MNACLQRLIKCAISYALNSGFARWSCSAKATCTEQIQISIHHSIIHHASCVMCHVSCIRLGTFFDIQNRLVLITSKIQTGYLFFHHIKNRLLAWTCVSKQVPVIDNLGVQLSVVQVVWTIQNHVTISDSIANTGCLAKKQNRLLACVQKMKPVIGLKQPC